MEQIPENSANPVPVKPPLGENEKLTHIVYGLQALSLVLGFTWIAAVIVNYIKRDEVKGTYLESHFTWQIRTFWIGLVAGAICFALFIIVIGIFLMPLLGVWLIYRVVRGWLLLNERKPVPNPESFI